VKLVIEILSQRMEERPAKRTDDPDRATERRLNPINLFPASEHEQIQRARCFEEKLRSVPTCVYRSILPLN
jgi:hypothetical protein